MQSFWLILAGLAFMLFSMELLEDFFGGLAKYMDKLMKKFTNTKIGSIVT